MTSPPLSDLNFVCRLCGEGFVFTAGEQELQRIRGVQRVPTRCSSCLRRPPTVPWTPTLTSLQPD
jgi:Probable zinc-ribbon domain